MENPYFSPDLAQVLIDRPKEVVLAGRALRLEPGADRSHLVVADIEPLLAGPIAFGLRGDEVVPPCPDAEAYLVDEGLLLIGAHGAVGPNDLLRDAHYLLLLTPDQITRVGRKVERPRLRRGERYAALEVWAASAWGETSLVISFPALHSEEIRRCSAALEGLLAQAPGPSRQWELWSDGWERLD
jgi:hypothetical protein